MTPHLFTDKKTRQKKMKRKMQTVTVFDIWIYMLIRLDMFNCFLTFVIVSSNFRLISTFEADDEPYKVCFVLMHDIATFSPK